MHLNGRQCGELSKAIASAFPQKNRLRDILVYKLGDDISNYEGTGDKYPDVRFELIQAYNARHQIDKLVTAMLEENSTNELLLEFAWRQQLIKRPAGAQGAGPEDGSLERMLEPGRGFSDVGTLLGRVGQIVNCVCQISYPTPAGMTFGTGFLVGNSSLITNWHVVEHVTPANRGQLKLRFDYRTGSDGKTISTGTEFGLLDDDHNWLLDFSPYHTSDKGSRTVAENLALNRPSDCLDYAVLQLQGAPGKLPVGINATENALPRGYLDLSAAVEIPDGSHPEAIWIFQHPYKDGVSLPLQLDWNKPALTGQNTNRTRVLYDVNTLPGSSGSPVFNTRLELIALHHAGGKDWPAPNEFLYNQGIPMVAIRNLLQARGVLSKIQA